MKQNKFYLQLLSDQARAAYLVEKRLFSWRYPWAYVCLLSQQAAIKNALSWAIKLWNQKTIFQFRLTGNAARKNGMVKIKNDPTLLKKLNALALTKNPHHDHVWQNAQVEIGIDLPYFTDPVLLKNVVAHELGHALGLPDVHFKSIAYGRDDHTYWLQPCDILAVQKIYGKKQEEGKEI